MIDHRLHSALLSAICLLALTLVGGCSCWKDPLGRANQVDKPKKPETLEEMEAARRDLLKQQKEKPDFETVRLTVLPADDARTKNQVKPGHWFSAVQTMKANNFDFPKGQLESQCVDTEGAPIKLPNTEFALSTTRPVSLPKGQQKHFDLLLFANMPDKGGSINFMSRLRPRGGGREVDWKYEAATRMKPFQNHFIVLAERSDNYQFLKAARSVRPERQSDDYVGTNFDYFVKLPKGTRRVDVPAHSLTWSNVAYVLWDDFDPEILNGDQQQAMIDWLHWGGQIIVNGPRTLDRLRSSAFASFLPARSGNVGAITDEQIAVLNDYWSFSDDGGNQLEVTEEKDRPAAVELELTPESQFMENTAELVAEKYVGRGRIVVTSFNLPHEVLLAWDSYDTFFNSCLLARPPRRFFMDRNSASVVENWAGSALLRDDARTTSTMRYFSRDAIAISTRSNSSRQFEPARASRGTSRSRRTNVPSGMVPLSSVMPVGREKYLPVSRQIQRSALRPTPAQMLLRIEGSRVLHVDQDDRFTVTFTNDGRKSAATDAELQLTVTPDLQITRATAGFSVSTNSDRQQVLTWRIQPVHPGFGGAIEFECAASTNDGAIASHILAEMAFDQGTSEDQFALDVVGSGDEQHELSLTASAAFGVNGFAKDDLIGVAGWSDQSDVSQAARESLEQSAGISVPSIEFIAKVLGIYLAILVPANWVLFRLIGRVEWAWAMVPLIAIGGALGVVHAAQLDIGFARSRTEVAVVEMQPDYHRAHVTRYVGFYTSLTSRYQIGGEDASSLLQPLSSSQPIGDRRVALHQGNQVSLSGFSIISNSTGMVHGEQMADVGGVLELTEASGRLVLKNDTDFDLRGAAVVRRNSVGRVEAAWIGDLKKKGRSTDVDFQVLTDPIVSFAQWDTLPATSKESAEGELNVRRLIEIATDPKRLGHGEAVLVGWNDQMMPGIVVKPQASQVTARTLFVAQLAHATRPKPQRDVNSFAVLARELKELKELSKDDEGYLGGF